MAQVRGRTKRYFQGGVLLDEAYGLRSTGYQGIKSAYRCKAQWQSKATRGAIKIGLLSRLEPPGQEEATPSRRETGPRGWEGISRNSRIREF